MRHALIIDTETTGLDPNVDACIEVAAILYDLEQAAPVASFASLIRCDRNPVYEINRITLRMLERSPEAGEVWPHVWRLSQSADVILAHHAEFDRGFVSPQVRDAKPWICTKFHVDWPHGKPGDHLVHLALAHGVGILEAHRALTDCDTISRLLTRVHHDEASEVNPFPLGGMLARAMRPRAKMVAIVSYADRDKAKANGFAWDAEKKAWWRDMPIEDMSALPFETRPA